MDEVIMEPIGSFEPKENVNQMDYLREFLIQDKRKSDFHTFIKKYSKKK